MLQAVSVIVVGRTKPPADKRRPATAPGAASVLGALGAEQSPPKNSQDPSLHLYAQPPRGPSARPQTKAAEARARRPEQILPPQRWAAFTTPPNSIRALYAACASCAFTVEYK